MSDLLPSLAGAGEAGVDLRGAGRASGGGSWAFLCALQSASAHSPRSGDLHLMPAQRGRNGCGEQRTASGWIVK